MRNKFSRLIDKIVIVDFYEDKNRYILFLIRWDLVHH